MLQVGGGTKVTLKNVRPPAKTLSLSAEAMVANGTDKSVAFVAYVEVAKRRDLGLPR